MDCKIALKQAKQELASLKVLAHYDIILSIKLAYVYPDGKEQPNAFATRTLSMAEHNYAQLENEALELVFGVKRFHPY